MTAEKTKAFCGEHSLRVKALEQLDTRLTEYIEKTDNRLEAGMIKFAGLERGQIIVGGILLLILTVAGLGYSRADGVKNDLNDHISATISNKAILESIAQRLTRIEAKMDAQQVAEIKKQVGP